MKKHIYVLVGLPATGKSTFTNQILAKESDWVVCSTDNIIEDIAKRSGRTYNDVWRDNISMADKRFFKELHSAIYRGDNIIVDRMHLNMKSRSKILNLIAKSSCRDNYIVTAIVFGTTLNPYEWVKRLNNRPGKIIPAHVLVSQAASFEFPSESEAFDGVCIIEDIKDTWK